MRDGNGQIRGYVESITQEPADQVFCADQHSKGSLTFSKQSPKLKESQTRKVIKYARRRMQKMDWQDLLQVTTPQIPLVEHSQIKLGELLGEGSFSSVFIERESPNVVVKVLRKNLIYKPAMLAACAADLLKEALLLGNLQDSDNIVRIRGAQRNGLFAYESGHHDGFFLLLERLEYTLSEKINVWSKRRNKLKKSLSFSKTTQKLKLLHERLEVIPQLAKGIACLHSKGIIHRDLKPDNIGYGRDGQWKIFDLDVARLVPASQAYSKEFHLTHRVGSPRYMSPENAKGERYNCTTDVYSFALLVHETLTLEKPYEFIPAEIHDECIFYNHTRPEIGGWPISLKTFLSRAWHKNWKIRPNLISDSSELDIILSDFIAYKKEGYGPKTRFGGKSKSRSVIPKDVELETSFQTQMTTSLRTDDVDMDRLALSNI